LLIIVSFYTCMHDEQARRRTDAAVHHWWPFERGGRS
jgi:hypothetical protein